MKILLMTMGLTLICGLHALKNNIEDPKKITGEWFTVGLASNVSSKIEEGGSLELFVKSISEQDGILSGEFLKRENGKCIPIHLTSFVGEDGEMHVQYDGLNDFSIQSLGPKHLVFMMYNIKDGEVTVWGELYGREPNLPDEIKKKFEEICESFGITKDQIRDVSSDGIPRMKYPCVSVNQSYFLRRIINMDDENFYWLSVLSSRLKEDAIPLHALPYHRQDSCLQMSNK